MYAVVDIKGFQFKCEKGEKVVVPYIAEAEVGDMVVFENVLMLCGDKSVVGTPLVSGASVSSTVLAHGRGDKVINFKKKRRKGFAKKKGHRQDYTEIQVVDVKGK